jgi:hypothetical protein
MSYHHANRLRDHLVPFSILEEFQGEFGGKERRKKLSPATQLVAWQIASSLNEKSNTWRLSIATIQARTGLSSQAIRDALKCLQKEGVLVRSRTGKRQAYSYCLAMQCPPDCELLDVHNTKSELAEAATKQSPEPAIEKHTNVLLPRPLIDNNKKTNKQLARSCFICKVEEELIAGKPKSIHVDNCKKFIDLQRTLPWEISESEIQGWLEMPPKDKQRAHHLRMSGVWATKEAEKLKLDGDSANLAIKFEDLISGRHLSRRVKQLLWARYRDKPDGIENFIDKAERRSLSGFDLDATIEVALGVWPQNESDWIQMGSDMALESNQHAIQVLK